jgi:hypothetical protein
MIKMTGRLRSLGEMLMHIFYICLIAFIFHAPTIDSKSKPSSTSTSSLTRRRILSELHEILAENISLSQPFNASDKLDCGIRLSPVKGNMLEWHFSFTGSEASVYEGGIYHGAILLDRSYPNKAPIIQMLSPSGRWEVGKPICLSGKRLPYVSSCLCQ